MSESTKFSAATLHLNIAKNIKRPYTFDPSRSFEEQRDAIEIKFRKLLKQPEKLTNPVPIIEYTDNSDPLFDETRFAFETEPNFFIPAHMLLPKTFNGKLPVVICIQGHSSGMHISLNRRKSEKDDSHLALPDNDFAIQAIKRGYAVFIMEQRGFGELHSDIAPNLGCNHLVMQAFELGRTFVGERTFDISQLIDAISGYDFLDIDRIGIMGQSGGGTAVYHEACVEKRVKVVMPSGYFCTYYDSIMSMGHCTCNYIPGILKYMEMPDLALMIAPRPIVIVNGRFDPIFPIAAAEEGFEVVKQIYKAAGAPDNCRFIIGEGEHRFYADLAWPVFDKYI